MSQSNSPLRFGVSRYCVGCQQAFRDPLEDGWTKVRIGDDLYWHCPMCTRDSAEKVESR